MLILRGSFESFFSLTALGELLCDLAPKLKDCVYIKF